MNYIKILLAKINHFNAKINHFDSKMADSNYSDILLLNYSSTKYHIRFSPNVRTYGMYVCLCMYVCMCVCMCVCMYVCVCVCTYIRTYINTCTYACMYVCTYVYVVQITHNLNDPCVLHVCRPAHSRHKNMCAKATHV